jgi:hypothetical protein
MRRKLSRRPKTCLLLGLLALSAGCARHDTEALARIGRKLGDRAETWIGEFKEHLDLGGGSSIEARVTQRLRWDKALADSPIEVKVRGSEVELKGILADPALKTRAVELAQSTRGVVNVIDSMQILDINPAPLPTDVAPPPELPSPKS